MALTAGADQPVILHNFQNTVLVAAAVMRRARMNEQTKMASHINIWVLKRSNNTLIYRAYWARYLIPMKVN
jgi:hypothetical protein